MLKVNQLQFLKIFIVAIVIICFVKPGFSQSVVYYPFNSLLGVSTNPGNRLWIDAKFQTNSFFSSLSTDVSPQINLNKNPKATFYTGAGLKFNYLNVFLGNKVLDGYFANFGVRTSPFEKLPKVQLVFEVSPFVSRAADGGIFRSHLGLGYNFSRK